MDTESNNTANSMPKTSSNLVGYILLTILLLASVGFNFVQYNQVQDLNEKNELYSAQLDQLTQSLQQDVENSDIGSSSSSLEGLPVDSGIEYITKTMKIQGLVVKEDNGIEVTFDITKDSDVEEDKVGAGNALVISKNSKPYMMIHYPYELMEQQGYSNADNIDADNYSDVVRVTSKKPFFTTEMTNKYSFPVTYVKKDALREGDSCTMTGEYAIYQGNATTSPCVTPSFAFADTGISIYCAEDPESQQMCDTIMKTIEFSRYGNSN